MRNLQKKIFKELTGMKMRDCKRKYLIIYLKKEVSLIKRKERKLPHRKWLKKKKKHIEE